MHFSPIFAHFLLSVFSYLKVHCDNSTSLAKKLSLGAQILSEPKRLPTYRRPTSIESNLRKFSSWFININLVSPDN